MCFYDFLLASTDKFPKLNRIGIFLTFLSSNLSVAKTVCLEVMF